MSNPRGAEHLPAELIQEMLEPFKKYLGSLDPKAAEYISGSKADFDSKYGTSISGRTFFPNYNVRVPGLNEVKPEPLKPQEYMNSEPYQRMAAIYQQAIGYDDLLKQVSNPEKIKVKSDIQQILLPIKRDPQSSRLLEEMITQQLQTSQYFNNMLNDFFKSKNIVLPENNPGDARPEAVKKQESQEIKDRYSRAIGFMVNMAIKDNVSLKLENSGPPSVQKDEEEKAQRFAQRKAAEELAAKAGRTTTFVEPTVKEAKEIKPNQERGAPLVRGNSFKRDNPRAMLVSKENSSSVAKDQPVNKVDTASVQQFNEGPAPSTKKSGKGLHLFTSLFSGSKEKAEQEKIKQAAAKEVPAPSIKNK